MKRNKILLSTILRTTPKIGGSLYCITTANSSRTGIIKSIYRFHNLLLLHSRPKHTDGKRVTMLRTENGVMEKKNIQAEIIKQSTYEHDITVLS